MKNSFVWLYSGWLYNERREVKHESRHLFFLIGLALVVRLIGITYGLPAVYNSTEYYIAKQALAMGARHSLEPLFFIYPTLYMYLIAIYAGVLYAVGLLGGVFHSPEDFAFQFLVNPTFFYLGGRLINAIFFLFAVYFLYRTIRFYLPVHLTFLLTACFIFSWNIQFYTFWMVPDAFLIFGAILVAFLTIQYKLYPHLKYTLPFSAAVAGLTISAKYNVGFLALLPIATLWLQKRQKGKVKLALTLISLTILGFLIGSPYWLLKFSEYWKGLQMLLTQSSVDFNTERGIPFIWELWAFIQTDWGIGLVVVLSLILSITCFHRNWVTELPVALVILFTFLTVGLMQKKGLDYLLIIIPLSFILLSQRMEQSEWVRNNMRKISLFLIILIFPSVLHVAHLKYQHTRTDTRELASQWIVNHVPHTALLCYDHYHFDLNLLDIQRFTRRGYGAQFLSPKLKRRLEKLTSRPDVYRFTPIRHQLNAPRWPKNFSAKDIQRFQNNPFLVEAYQHPFKTLHELQVEGVTWLIVNGDWAMKFKNAPLPPKDNPLYPIYLQKKRFYQALWQHYSPIITFYPNWETPGPPIFIFNLASSSF